MPYYHGPAGLSSFHPLNEQETETFERLQPDVPRKNNNQFLISPMKYTSPSREQLYTDAMGEQFVGVHAIAYRHLNTVSPNRLLL